MKPADVLLLTNERDTAAAVDKAVRSGSVQGETCVCRSMMELRLRLSKAVSNNTRAVAIVDIDDSPQQTLYDLTKTITSNPATLFVVVSSEFNEHLVLQAMQAGARHFLRKSAIGAELDPVLGRLLLHEPERTSHMGDVVSVFSCSGGCGATTVAVNLVAEIALAATQPSLLIDLDPHYGSVAQYMGVQGKYGVAHMLKREDAVDRHLVESCVAHVNDRVDVLLSPAAAEADKNIELNYAHLPAVVETCRELYGWVVVDAPRLPERAVADLASISRMAVIVLQLTVRDAAYARAIVTLLTEQGMTRDRVLVVVNQAGRRGATLNVREVQRGLGVQSLLRIRTDRRKAIRSTTYGRPLAQSARFSGLRRDIRRVARQVQQWTLNGNPGKGGA